MDRLTTETPNPQTRDLDLLSPGDIAGIMLDEDRKVIEAVKSELPSIVQAIDLVVHTLIHSGRLIYVGAGTSGRLGVLDASECKPTFGVSDDQVVAMIAGGRDAVFKAVEAAEDDEGAGRRDIEQLKVSSPDCVVGIAASGSTPYVIAALIRARELGAKTVGLTCNRGTAMEAASDVCIAAVVGPEILTGSTRLKAGTAQKMILNMLSTISMVHAGRVYGNYMVDMVPTNSKLIRRAVTQLVEITGVDASRARAALDSAHGNIKTAAVMLMQGCPAEEARLRLEREHGFLRKALAVAR